MKQKRPRRTGERIDFKSLACAPINEQGVVYLFGVMHETFDLKVESVQTGFPDCVAVRDVGDDRREKVRIEFEFKSSNFRAHKHDPFGADVIVCWLHDWEQCPEHLEVIELSGLVEDLEGINLEIRTPKKLSEWQAFCRKKRLDGLTFDEIATMWRNRHLDRKGKPLTPWQQFCREKRLEGLEFGEIVKLWKGRG